ncbi:uncharacterized protein MYCFIDRAFT_204357 [Pseudocercospora fijiensis CIRAD86]|uniref:Uncharacterized protein n=1 Tax=Pseudocercospora fijiensis (strain CIRAD86) TaxID=383855 RepID=M3AR08_PSEFD|nr:uncharacterized protein MYCFIDRAFT_204357 [Pseudocercospora fijiensis CIRAD86]EME79862.1 hypothetical protein MYCFIDRAFT_204357 [Pseudocercospora fijiensis CIRAD86]
MLITRASRGALINHQNTGSCVGGRQEGQTFASERHNCLLGILDVSMPVVYGEGSKASLRLRKEIFEKQRPPSSAQQPPHPSTESNIESEHEILARVRRNAAGVR